MDIALVSTRRRGARASSGTHARDDAAKKGADSSVPTASSLPYSPARLPCLFHFFTA
jgi:hypothetical protein